MFPVEGEPGCALELCQWFESSCWDAALSPSLLSPSTADGVPSSTLSLTASPVAGCVSEDWSLLSLRTLADAVTGVLASCL